MADLTFDQMTDEEYAPIKARLLDRLGNLLVAHFGGTVPAGVDFDAECDEIAMKLGLIPDPDVEAREPRGHAKGLRAAPVDYRRRGSVAS